MGTYECVKTTLDIKLRQVLTKAWDLERSQYLFKYEQIMDRLRRYDQEANSTTS